MIDAQLPGKWKTYQTSITANETTRAKILVQESQPVVLPAITGETVLPGETVVRQRVLSGGQRVFDGSFSSTDGTARSVLIWIGTVLTRQANMGVASTAGTNTINRTVGSFLTDGFLPGDDVMMFDAPTAANNGVLGIATGVTATVITVNGTPFTNETLTTVRVCRVAQRTRRALAINAGNLDTTPAVQLIGGSQDPSAFLSPDAGISLDENSIIAVSAVATISILPAQIEAFAVSALY